MSIYLAYFRRSLSPHRLFFHALQYFMKMVLAKDLMEKAELNVTLPIPVIFNLSSWINIKQLIADLLVQ